ncbi:MAG: DUF2029 domain-containing protein [Planctomycetes bacterium]|nr:DUF2029 domain-containing protein [Planctomycetota bacterium]
MALGITGALLSLCITTFYGSSGPEGGDFYVYYDSFHRFEQEPDKLYEWLEPDAPEHVKARPFLYPPFALLPVGLFAKLPRAAAWPLWALLETTLIVPLVLLAMRAARPPTRSARIHSGLAIASILTPLAWWELSIGQINILVITLVAAALVLHQKRRTPLAVFVLMLAGGIKLLPFVLVPVFVWWAGPKQRLWAIALALLGGLVIAIGPALWVTGTHGPRGALEATFRLNQTYFGRALPRGTSPGSFYYGSDAAGNFSIPATTSRVVNKVARRFTGAGLTASQDHTVRRVAMGATLGFSGLFALLALRAMRARRTQLSLAGVLLCLILFANVSTWAYHLVGLVLLVPALGWSNRVSSRVPWAGLTAAVCNWGVAVPYAIWALGLDVPVLSGMADRGFSTLAAAAWVATLLLMLSRRVWKRRTSPAP